MCLCSAPTLQWEGGKGLKWLIQRTDTEQRIKGPNEWVEEVVLEAHALYSEGTEMTCCSFLAVSDQSYNCISYFFLFFRLLYFVLWKPGDLLIPSLSPAIPIITFYLQTTQLFEEKKWYNGTGFVIHLARNFSCVVLSCGKHVLRIPTIPIIIIYLETSHPFPRILSLQSPHIAVRDAGCGKESGSLFY